MRTKFIVIKNCCLVVQVLYEDLLHCRCKEQGRYLTTLPATSVVICFHNEAWSVLLRTVHSVIDRSPPHLLKEIVLVDDFSDMGIHTPFIRFLLLVFSHFVISLKNAEHVKGPLEDYMAQYPKVKIVRLPKREGLIRARLLGLEHSTAPVVTYLDSHCECTEGKSCFKIKLKSFNNEYLIIVPTKQYNS